MTPNFAHKIVHSSAMYYQNLIMIHECSKKLLKMKNFFLTPSTSIAEILWKTGSKIYFTIESILKIFNILSHFVSF